MSWADIIYWGTMWAFLPGGVSILLWRRWILEGIQMRIFVRFCVRQQVVTWAYVDEDLCRHMTSLGHFGWRHLCENQKQIRNHDIPRFTHSTLWWEVRCCPSTVRCQGICSRSDGLSRPLVYKRYRHLMDNILINGKHFALIEVLCVRKCCSDHVNKDVCLQPIF